MQVQLSSIPVHVQEKLGGFPDPRRGVKGMPPSDQRKKGHRIQLKQIGAGHPEEISHHQIRIPGGLQPGKTVEHIKGVLPFLRNSLMDRHREGLKAQLRLKFADFYPFPFLRQHGLMLGEPDVDQISPVRYGLTRERARKKEIFLQGGDLKHHVVSQPDIIQQLIHTADSALYLIKGRHLNLSFRRRKRHSIPVPFHEKRRRKSTHRTPASSILL